jgi:2-polyprenyl-3-methyl-5-hydroxy-6-metoxy-1,4-benzoquinol methylase
MRIISHHMNVEARARQSQGSSSDAIYTMVARCLKQHRAAGTLLDVGCGTGTLWSFVSDSFDNYFGADIIHYSSFPPDGHFIPVDLDQQRILLADEVADVVTALETIEHVENPRELFRELVRLLRPGGWLLITTPNQLSLLSKLTLLLKNQFNAFQDRDYPAHLTALLEVDLQRIAAECGLQEVRIGYSGQGRLVLTSGHYPRIVSRWLPRAFSDNVLLIGRKPHCTN